MNSKRTFLFCSNRAFYPPYLKVAELITRNYNLDGHVIGPVRYDDSPIWAPPGKHSGSEPIKNSTLLNVHLLEAKNDDVERFGFNEKQIKILLKKMKPDYIWIHGEFWEGITYQILRRYRFNKKPQIVSFIAINHLEKSRAIISRQWPFVKRSVLMNRLLWPRLDTVLACSTKAMECARGLGLPKSVPIVVNYLPVFGPEDVDGIPIELPWNDNSFIIGYVGLLSKQKGWKILLSVLEMLPAKFKLVIVGDGEEKEDLLELMKKSKMKNRIYYAGLLTKENVISSYKLFDVLILPSITTEHSVEQFGAVLAEAMACGVPVIGSSSGAIPETIGDAGLIFPEGNIKALAALIMKIFNNESLREVFFTKGLKRFNRYYSCNAYAHSLARLLGLRN